jgi:hypothetical protein
VKQNSALDGDNLSTFDEGFGRHGALTGIGAPNMKVKKSLNDFKPNQ